MASSDFLHSIARHFGFRLIGTLTVLAAPTAQDLVRSLTLPSAHAVAQNAGGDHRFISLSIRVVAVFVERQLDHPILQTLPVILVRTFGTA